MDDVEGRQREMKVLCGYMIVAALACTSPVPRAPDGRELRPVSLPDLSRTTESVQTQIRGRYASLMAKIENRADAPVELGEAYGEMGKLLMAGEYADAAESCLLNAQMLASSDFRWPYYLAHLYRDKGELAKSRASFEQALQLQPDDVATLVWLGDVHLAQGQPDQAEPRFTKALSLQPNSLSARFGLGRVALATNQYTRAVTYLEDVLARDPGAVAAHYPLAMAYRGLGRVDKAEGHLRQREEHEILPADPLMVELEELLESPQAFESRGIRALDRNDFVEAAALFRKGLELAPDHPALRHRLGTALYMMGDAHGAQTEFEAVVRVSPDYSLAQYSLGVLLQSNGRHTEAIERFSTALRSRPSYTEARLRLAASLRRTGRAGESLQHYDQILTLNPDLTEARFGAAMAFVQLRRYQEARDRLTEAMKAHPDQTVFAHGVARLLAAAPDDRVRDGQRAMALVQELLRKEQRTVEYGETMAMALAELRRYDEAVALQRQLMAGAEKAGLEDVARRLAGNLERYERREPCRTPWTDEEMP
jgi:tetratricopeptide (TPR) repeat protein